MPWLKDFANVTKVGGGIIVDGRRRYSLVAVDTVPLPERPTEVLV